MSVLIKGIKQDKPVEFYPYVSRDCYSEPLDDKEFYLMDASIVQSFIDELAEFGALHLITETLQCLCQRDDGTVLNTAFPEMGEFIQVAQKMQSIPKDLLDNLHRWEYLGANQIDMNFELKKAWEYE